MIRHNDKRDLRDVTFGAGQDRSNLFGFAALRLRARFARDGSGPISNGNGPNFPRKVDGGTQIPPQPAELVVPTCLAPHTGHNYSPQCCRAQSFRMVDCG